jgi:hypothetical protein
MRGSTGLTSITVLWSEGQCCGGGRGSWYKLLGPAGAEGCPTVLVCFFVIVGTIFFFLLEPLLPLLLLLYRVAVARHHARETLTRLLGLPWTGDQLVAEVCTGIKQQTLNISAPSWIRTRDPSSRAATDLFSAALDGIRLWLVVLTALAASGHLAYDAVCFVSFSLAGPRLPWGPKTFSHRGPDSLETVGLKVWERK